MEPILVLSPTLGAYLLGSIPSGYLVARLAQGVDIRRVGTDNLGA